MMLKSGCRTGLCAWVYSLGFCEWYDDIVRVVASIGRLAWEVL